MKNIKFLFVASLFALTAAIYAVPMASATTIGTNISTVDLTTTGALTIGGASTLNGNVTLGDTSTDIIGVNGSINTDILFVKEVNRAIRIDDSTTGAGSTLTIFGGGGAAGSNGGMAVLVGGNAGTTGTGGMAGLAGGTGGTTGTGGDIGILSGNGGSTSGNSGAITIKSGTTTSGNSGNISIQSRTPLGANSNSGFVNIFSGNAAGSGSAGTISITAGNAAASTSNNNAGAIRITAGTGGTGNFSGGTSQLTGGTGGMGGIGGMGGNAVIFGGNGGNLLAPGPGPAGGNGIVNGGTGSNGNGAGNNGGTGGGSNLMAGNGGSAGGAGGSGGMGGAISITAGNGGNGGAGGTEGNGGNVTINGGMGLMKGNINIDNITGGGVTIGSPTGIATITLGQSTGTNTIAIGNANTLDLATQTINIGAGTPAGTGKATITIGNTNDASALNLYAGTGGIIIGNSTATNTIAIGNATTADTKTQTILIGRNATGTGKTTVSIGSTNAASSLILEAGTGHVNIGGADATDYNIGTATTTGRINIGRSQNTNQIYIGVSNLNEGATQTIYIGGTAADTDVGASNIYIGSATRSNSLVTLRGGGIELNGVDSAHYTIGGANTTGNTTLGLSTDTNTIAIGNARTANTKTQTINIGAGTPADGGTGKAVIAIGNTGNASELNLYAGTGGIKIGCQTGIDGCAAGTGGINIGTGGINIGQSTSSNTITIGNANTATEQTQEINIGAGAPIGTGKAIIRIGNTAAASSLALSAGSAGISIDSGTAGNISLGLTSSTATGSITIGNTTASNTIFIGNNNTKDGAWQQIMIGNGTPAETTGKTSIWIGNTVHDSFLGLYAGTGGVSIIGGSVQIKGAINYGSLSGTNAYALNPVGTIALTDGQVIYFKLENNASTGASTLAVNGLAAKKMLKGSDNATQINNGDLIAYGSYMAIYNSSLDTGSGAWVVLNK